MKEFPKLISQTWKTHDIPDLHKPWVESWKKYHPDYEYVLWDDNENRVFVEKYYPEYLSAYNAFFAEIYRADFVRCLFLHKYGGIYADIDFECLRPLDPYLEENNKYNIILGRMAGGKVFYSIPNAIMISKPGHPFWIRMSENICNGFIPTVKEKSRRTNPENLTGPVRLERTLAEYDNESKKDILISPPDVFYPLSWKSIKANHGKGKLIAKLKRAEAEAQGSYAITYWCNSWWTQFV